MLLFAFEIAYTVPIVYSLEVSNTVSVCPPRCPLSEPMLTQQSAIAKFYPPQETNAPEKGKSKTENNGAKCVDPPSTAFHSLCDST